MNFFRKIGSFASSSWKDFSEYYDQQQHQQQPLEAAETSDNKLVENDDDSFALRKRSEKELAAKKVAHRFFRKHFSRKKLQMLDDPRSPTIDFERTPIQTFESPAGILSPFNVNDMLSTVESAVGTPKKSTDIHLDAVPSNEALLEDKDFIGNVGDWNDFNFNCDKVMTESLIVELSTLDIKDDLDTTIEQANNETPEEAEEALLSTFGEPTQCLLDSLADKKADKNCKVVGCIVKNEEEAAASELPMSTPVEQKAEPLMIVTSTPKKTNNSKLSEESKKNARTPLQSISNSPMVSSNKNALGVGTAQKKVNSEMHKKKKISACARQLPKAPSTPLTPLFKGSVSQSVSHFDKENF